VVLFTKEYTDIRALLPVSNFPNKINPTQILPIIISTITSNSVYIHPNTLFCNLTYHLTLCNLSSLWDERRLRVFEKRMFGPKRDDVTEELRKLHNDELNGLYSSPTIVRVIKSRRIRSAGHVTHLGERCIKDFGGET
jgi:hypothetical protein